MKQRYVVVVLVTHMYTDITCIQNYEFNIFVFQVSNKKIVIYVNYSTKIKNYEQLWKNIKMCWNSSCLNIVSICHAWFIRQNWKKTFLNRKNLRQSESKHVNFTNAKYLLMCNLSQIQFRRDASAIYKNYMDAYKLFRGKKN